MVATDKEAKDIVDILLHYMPTGMAETMFEEIWNDIGCVTENESLRDTILILKFFIKKSKEFGN